MLYDGTKGFRRVNGSTGRGANGASRGERIGTGGGMIIRNMEVA